MREKATQALEDVVDFLIDAELKGKSPIEALLFIMKKNKEFKEKHVNQKGEI